MQKQEGKIAFLKQADAQYLSVKNIRFFLFRANLMTQPLFFGGTDGSFANGKYTRTFRLTSKLVDLQVVYVHPYSRRNISTFIAQLLCLLIHPAMHEPIHLTKIPQKRVVKRCINVGKNSEKVCNYTPLFV